MRAQRRAALLVPPGGDPLKWMHQHGAAAEAHGLAVTTFAWGWQDLMRILWCERSVEVGVVGSRREVDESWLMVAEEARQPPPPPIPGQVRPQWAPRSGW